MTEKERKKCTVDTGTRSTAQDQRARGERLFGKMRNLRPAIRKCFEVFRISDDIWHRFWCDIKLLWGHLDGVEELFRGARARQCEHRCQLCALTTCICIMCQCNNNNALPLFLSPWSSVSHIYATVQMLIGVYVCACVRAYFTFHSN